MGISCCVVGCSNKAIKGSGLSFHTFPFRDKALLEKWIVAVKRDQWEPTKFTKICSAHFLPDDYYPDQGKRMLREDVVPSVFPFRPAVKRRPPPKNRQPLEKTVKRPKKTTPVKFSSSMEPSRDAKKLHTEPEVPKLADTKKRKLDNKSTPNTRVEPESESVSFEYTILRLPIDGDPLSCTSDNKSANEIEVLNEDENTCDLLENEIFPLTNESDYENQPDSHNTPCTSRSPSPELPDLNSLSPTMKRYLRNRKSFMKLGPEDVDTPLKARFNLKYGQQTVKRYQNKINDLKALESRLKKKKEALQEYLIQLLEQRNGVLPTSSNTLPEMPNSPDTSTNNFISVDTNISPNSSDTLSASSIEMDTNTGQVDLRSKKQLEELPENIRDALKTKIRSFDYADDLNMSLMRFKSRIENAKTREELLHVLNGSGVQVQK